MCLWLVPTKADYGAGCAPGIWWVWHATRYPKAHSTPSQRATTLLSSSAKAENKFIPVSRPCVLTPLEVDFPTHLSRLQILSAFLVGDFLHGHKVQSQQETHV